MEFDADGAVRQLLRPASRVEQGPDSSNAPEAAIRFGLEHSHLSTAMTGQPS